MTDLTGHTLGRYQLIERLGRGGMADVYKAYQPGLDRYVAIKVMHPHLADQPEFITRFKREAQAVARLKHPNIIQVYDFDVQDGWYFMSMEYVEGSRTLKQVLEEFNAQGKRIPLENIVDIVGKVADALDFAHRHAMVHRDVKPANILIPSLDSPLLSDFGIARLMDQSGLTATSVSIGTPAYMSPEQGRGEVADERSDIYALGIVLYELLAGKPPYDADTPYGVILKHINDPLIPPHVLVKDLPDDVERIVLKSLAKNPQDRYASAAQMRDDLLKAAARLATKAVPVKSTRAVVPMPARKPPEPEAQAPAEMEEVAIPGEIGATVSQRKVSTAIVPPKAGKKRNLLLWGLAAAGLITVTVGGFLLVNSLLASKTTPMPPTMAPINIPPTEKPKPTATVSATKTPTAIPPTGKFLNITTYDVSVCLGEENCQEIPVFTEVHVFGGGGWSPDGTEFVLAARPVNQSSGLYIANESGDVRTVIPSGTETNVVNPVWSPDGVWIAYHGSGQLRIIHQDGSNERVLVEESSTTCPFGAAWSPDGRYIAFIGGICAETPHYVWVINRDGTHQAMIYTSATGINDGMIAWSPDGKSIAVQFSNDRVGQITINCGSVNEGCVVGSLSTLDEFPWEWSEQYAPLR